MVKLITQALPLKFKGMHACGLPWWIEAPARLALSLMPSGLNQRIHFATWHSIHEVCGCGGGGVDLGAG